MTPEDSDHDHLVEMYRQILEKANGVVDDEMIGQ